MQKNSKFPGAGTILNWRKKLKIIYVLRPFKFVIYLKFQGNWLYIQGVRAKKRKPKWLKRTIVSI